MAEAQLSVELTAKIDGFRNNLKIAGQDVSNFAVDADGKITSFGKTVNRLEQQLKTFQQGLKNSLDPSRIATLNSAIEITKSKIEATNKVIAGGGGFKSLTAGSNQAAFALTNLGRVAQDAPFGFIGIQNNLNPLLESFTRLKQETGSSSLALKALGSSLIGPAGLGVALSLVTSAITFYTMYQQKHNKVLKESKSTSDDYISTLDQLSQVQLKGAENALKEQTELSTLYSITQNVTLSHKQRLDAVNALQDKYPSYFKNIKDENFLNGEAKNAYDDLTTSILATARARAAQDLITKNSSRQLENESKITRLRIEQQKALNAERAAAKLNNAANENITAGSTGNIITAKALNDATNVRLDLDKQISNLTTDTNKLTENNLQLTKSVNTEITKGAELTGQTGKGATDRVKDVRTLADVMRELNIELLQAENHFSGTFGDQTNAKINANQKAIDDLIKLGIDPASEAILKLKAAQDRLLKTDAVDHKNLLLDVPGLNTNNIQSDFTPIQIAPILDLTPVIVGKSELDKALADLENKKEQFLSLGNVFQTTSGALSNGFEAIGASLANGGNVIEAFGQVIINAFGNFLAELGKQTVAEGLFHIAKGVAYASNPLTAALAAGEFATGGGLVAAGGLLSVGGGLLSSSKSGGSTGGAQQPTAFANGGIIYGPTLGLMGEYAGAKSDPEVVAPLSKLKAILGQSDDLNLTTAQSRQASTGNVFNSTTNSYGSNGTTPTINVHAPQPIVIVPEFKMRGRDMYLMFKQEEAKQKRI